MQEGMIRFYPRDPSSHPTTAIPPDCDAMGSFNRFRRITLRFVKVTDPPEALYLG